MWEAYRAGTIPVGAVVTDESGAIVARGRNRIFDEPAGRELGASRLPHAEINALLALSSDRTYEDWTLWSALEPCHLCLAAAHSVRIGTVCFAGRDRYGGPTGKLAPSADHLAHPVTVEGPSTARPAASRNCCSSRCSSGAARTATSSASSRRATPSCLGRRNRLRGGGLSSLPALRRTCNGNAGERTRTSKERQPHRDLNPARLPVPPHPRTAQATSLQAPTSYAAPGVPPITISVVGDAADSNFRFAPGSQCTADPAGTRTSSPSSVAFTSPAWTK